MQSRRRRKKAARRRCARPIKAKPAPVRSSQSRGRAVVAEPEILRRGYDGHRQSEGIRFFAGPRRAHLASNPSQRRQESERRRRSLCVCRDPARGWHRPSLIPASSSPSGPAAWVCNITRRTHLQKCNGRSAISTPPRALGAGRLCNGKAAAPQRARPRFFAGHKKKPGPLARSRPHAAIRRR